MPRFRITVAATGRTYFYNEPNPWDAWSHFTIFVRIAQSLDEDGLNIVRKRPDLYGLDQMLEFRQLPPIGGRHESTCKPGVKRHRELTPWRHPEVTPGLLINQVELRSSRWPG